MWVFSCDAGQVYSAAERKCKKLKVTTAGYRGESTEALTNVNTKVNFIPSEDYSTPVYASTTGIATKQIIPITDQTTNRMNISTSKQPKYHQTSVATPAPTSTSEKTLKSLVCPDGYLKFNNDCFRIHNQLRTWEDASKICKRENAMLTKIDSEEMNSFLVDKMFPVGSSSNAFWIGLKDRKKTGRFSWSDGSRLTRASYKKWSLFARKREKRMRACVVVSRIYKNKWKDEICSREFPFVCQKKAEGAPVRKNPHHKCRASGFKPPKTLGVVGGKEARENAFPWHASLRSASGGHVCGGSLIDGCWVLTAAHCVESLQLNRDPSARPTRVVIGENDLDVTPAVDVTIDRAFVHYGYDLRYPQNDDVALLRLSNCDHGRAPVCMATGDVAEGRSCTVMGFGATNADGDSYPSKLHHADVPVISNDVCVSYFRQSHSTNLRRSLLTPKMLCAGFEEGGVDGCYGDSGGPLVCDDKLTALTSWGLGLRCAKEKSPGVYMKVSSYMKWIRDVTNIEF